MPLKSREISWNLQISKIWRWIDGSMDLGSFMDPSWILQIVVSWGTSAGAAELEHRGATLRSHEQRCRSGRSRKSNGNHWVSLFPNFIVSAGKPSFPLQTANSSAKMNEKRWKWIFRYIYIYLIYLDGVDAFWHWSVIHNPNSVKYAQWTFENPSMNEAEFKFFFCF